MKILHIFRRFVHHSSYSGYDQLLKYLPASQYQPGKIFRFLYSKKEERFRKIFKPIDPEWYSFENYCLEMELFTRMNLVNRTIFHMLYGENFFRYLGYVPFRRGNRVVVSFHQPPEVFPRAIQDHGRVASADAIVVVGSNQVDYFRQMTKRDNVYLLPHGIDTSFFTPAAARPVDDGPVRCVSVGWWLRDVDMIKKVIGTLNQIQGRRFEFHIVAFDWCLKFYEGLENVHLYCDIPDERLRDLYRQSDLLLLPLNDCTANNAVLEAMACGLPVFSSEAGSIRDYLGDSNAVLAPQHDADFMVDRLLHYHDHREELRRMGEDSRRRAGQFAWPLMAAQTMDFYRKIS